MFDFGFSELILIAVVMLIVVGPERLPKVARTAGHLLGRLQRYVTDVKSDIQREMQLEDLKKLQQQVEQQARELESSMRGQVSQVESELKKTGDEVKAGLEPGTGAAEVREASPEVSVANAADPLPNLDEEGSGERLAAVDDARKANGQLELGLDAEAGARSPAEKA